MKRSPSRGSQESCPSPPGKKDSELELILRRRRNKAGEAGSGGKQHNNNNAGHAVPCVSFMRYLETNMGLSEDPC